MLNGRTRAGRWAWVLAIGVAIGSAGSYGALLLATGNVHSVIDGVLYRSAELDETQVETGLRQRGIKSILKLRGGHLTDPWYADEIEVSKEFGVSHFDFPISARRRVTPWAAFFLLDAEHAGRAEADRQLSLAYGHFPYLLSKTVAMDESFWEFAGLSGAPNVAGR